MTQHETAEEHAGNALQIIRGLRELGRKPTGEEFLAVATRLQRALAKWVRENGTAARLQDEIDNCMCQHFPTPLTRYGDNCPKCGPLRAKLRALTSPTTKEEA